MYKNRITVIAILALLTGWTGLLGNAGVAVLCIHGGKFIHFLNEGHEIECCGKIEGHPAKDLFSVSQLNECNHCFDLELKGVDGETLFRTGIKDIPVPRLAVSQVRFIDLVSSSFELSKRTLPLLRAPPSVNTMTELFIKKTVLRL